MGREHERIQRKLENNPIAECNKVRQRYCPRLFQDFADTKDPRNLSYIDYSNKRMLGIVQLIVVEELTLQGAGCGKAARPVL